MGESQGKKIRIDTIAPPIEVIEAWRKGKAADFFLSDEEPFEMFNRIVQDEDATDKLLAMVEHPWEKFLAMAISPRAWQNLYGVQPPEPYLCWLAEEGWVDPGVIFNGNYPVREIANVWRAACQRAALSMQEDGSVLNYLSLQIIKSYSLSSGWLTLNPGEADESLGMLGLLKDTRKEIPPIGPGFENWEKNFVEWAKDQDQIGLEPLMGNRTRSVWTLILRHSALAGSYDGVVFLTRLMKHGGVEMLYSLLDNNKLDPRNEALTEWAVHEVLDSEDMLGGAAMEFWLGFEAEGRRLSDVLMDRIKASIEVGGIIQAHAWVGEIYKDPALKNMVLSSGVDEEMIALRYLVGKEWLDLAIKVSQYMYSSKQTLVDTLGAVRMDQLKGLNRKDLIPLIRSENRDVRLAALPLVRALEGQDAQEIRQPSTIGGQ